MIATEDRLLKAKEEVALYTLKMNVLRQEYFSMDNMTSRSHIQQQISDTYLKLQKALRHVDLAKQDLDEARKKKNYRK